MVWWLWSYFLSSHRHNSFSFSPQVIYLLATDKRPLVRIYYAMYLHQKILSMQAFVGIFSIHHLVLDTKPASRYKICLPTAYQALTTHICTLAKAGGDDLGGFYLLAVFKTAYLNAISLTTIPLLKTPTSNIRFIIKDRKMDDAEGMQSSTWWCWQR